MKRLKATHLAKSYGKKEIVKDVTFEVEEGQVVGLLGPNGAGKTTSFYMVVGLIKPDQGQITLNDKVITNLPMHKRARQGIAYLPQESSVFRKMTVQDNILCVLETLNLKSAEKRSRLKTLLADFGIADIANQKAFTLSGGERRRVEVARAIALNPIFLLLDEPFAGIDPIAVSDIQKIINTLKSKGIGILITDHNVRETLAICDLGYLLNHGSILEKGSALEISESQTARKIYLGDVFKI